MEQRINVAAAGEGVMKAMLGLSGYVSKSGLEKQLLNLIDFRVSQINGCAYCLDMHSKDLRAASESEQRLYLLEAWRESPHYTDRERAALEWAESVTLITQGHVPDEVYERVRAQFTEEELINLTMAVVAINSWNRLNIALRTVPGTYKPATAHSAAQF